MHTVDINTKEINITPSKKACKAEWYFFVSPVILGILILATLASVYLANFMPILWILIADFILLVVLAIVVLLSGYMAKTNWEQTKYMITKDKVTAFEGDNQKTYGMRGYTSMRLDKSLIQRVFKSGKITLFFMGGGSVELDNVDNPEMIIDRIEKLQTS